MSNLLQRSEIVFLYDIKDANPNGDPLDGNKPRMDEETGINLVTDVRLKRTIRDYLYDFKGQEIFVREIFKENGTIQSGKERSADFGKDAQEVAKNVLDKCIDVRLFGATIPLNNNSVTFTGPVQFNMGRSLHKVEVTYIKGTGAFASGESSKQKTFREEYIVPYSLIGFYGIINENAAQHTNLAEQDVDLLMEAIWNGTKNLISRSKIGQMPRLLLKVDYAEHSYHIGDLLSGIKLITSKSDEREIRGMDDFVLDFSGLVNKLEKNRQRIAGIKLQVDEGLQIQKEGQAIELAKVISDLGIKLDVMQF
ncbi:type I-B CRISPR-associated protein Cas7/Csh2 [Bacillota bacterium LX-D]|nr:type I-B CRISPR-associated protein Cas7/Csh2 [Bacillota bacterium LX-D]